MNRFQVIAITSIVGCAELARAWGPPGGWNGNGGDGSDDGDGGDGYGGFGSGGSGFVGSSGEFGVGFDIQTAERYRNIHGILAAVAFVIIFPLGAIFMRLIPGRLSLWIHSLTQIIGYAAFLAAAALGFYLIKIVRIPANDQSLLSSSQTNYHPIIGIVVFALLLFQPLMGVIHHYRFKRIKRRQIWSYLHIWNGRGLMIAGIVNGGLGLKLAGASKHLKIAYAVVAGVLGGLWLFIAVISELRRPSRPKEPGRRGTQNRRTTYRRRHDRTEKVLPRSTGR